MPVRLCAHLPDVAAVVRTLDESRTYDLGRAPDCDIVIDHNSVSRRHARLTFAGGAWWLTDLGSKNGVRIDGLGTDSGSLRSGQWFSLGDVFCQVDELDAAELAAQSAHADHRRQNSRAWIDRIHHAQNLASLLAELMTAMVEIAECRRGFLLAGDHLKGLHVLACYRLNPEDLGSKRFLYSTGAVDRAMLERRPVFLSNPQDRAVLQGNASIVAQDLRVVACLPLIHKGRMLGAAYADSDEEGKTFTEFDAELLSGFAAEAALAMATGDVRGAIAQFDSWVAVSERGRHAIHGHPSRWSSRS